MKLIWFIGLFSGRFRLSLVFIAWFGFSTIMLVLIFCCSLLLLVARSCSFWSFFSLCQLPVSGQELARMNKKCSLLLVLVFVACFHLPFVLVFEIESVLSQKTTQTNAFCCSFWFFCGCFHLNFALLVLVFCWYEKTKTSNKRHSPNGNQALKRRLPHFGTFYHESLRPLL